MIVSPSVIDSSQVDQIKLIVNNNGKDSLKLDDQLSMEFYDGANWKFFLFLKAC